MNNNNVDVQPKSTFFTRSKTSTSPSITKPNTPISLDRNDSERKMELEKTTAADAKVDISSAVKDFSRIKKAVDESPTLDKSERISELKGKINRGEYNFDYDAIAQKMLEQQY